MVPDLSVVTDLAIKVLWAGLKCMLFFKYKLYYSGGWIFKQEITSILLNTLTMANIRSNVLLQGETFGHKYFDLFSLSFQHKFFFPQV